MVISNGVEYNLSANASNLVHSVLFETLGILDNDTVISIIDDDGSDGFWIEMDQEPRPIMLFTVYAYDENDDYH